MKKINLSIIVPAYNEAKNFEKGVWDLSLEFLKKQKFSYEVLFVDDGSTDRTFNLLKSFCEKQKRLGNDFSVITIDHGGKAIAVKTGILKAKGRIILFCDFDQATPLETVNRYLEEHNNGADIVIGDRTKDRSGASDTFFQKFRSDVFVWITRITLGVNANDTQCGFKSLTNIAAQKIFNSFRVSAQPGKIVGGYMGAFDVELLFLAAKFGYKLIQVPVKRDDPYGAMGKYNNKWREPIMMIRDILKVRLFDILGKYDHLTNSSAT